MTKRFPHLYDNSPIKYLVNYLSLSASQNSKTMDDTKGIGKPTENTPSVKKGKNYVLAIGIDDYTHCPKLKNAVKDAKDLVALLTERYDFDATCISELFDADATKRLILAKLRDLAQKITPDDNCIIYFSGHGEFDKVVQQGFWIPVHAERGEYDDYLPNSTIRDMLNAINSRHTFLIADSCFSGTLFSSKDANRDISDRLERDPSRWGLTAGRNEIVDDGKPGTNSPFAEKLLDVLRKNDKPLGVAEICAKMMEIVQANAEQTPRGEPLKIRGHEGGQFFFHPRNNEVEDWTHLDKTAITALEGFKKKYPHSTFIVETDKTIAQLTKEKLAQEHTAIWERTKRKNTANAYLDFWEKYVDSPYRAEALQSLADAEDNEEWQSTPPTRMGMLRYLNKFPDGLHAAEAQAALVTFRNQQQEIERLEREKKEQAQAEKDKAEADRLEKENKEKAQAEKEKQAKERLDREKDKAEALRLEKEKKEKAQAEWEKQEKGRLKQVEMEKEAPPQYEPDSHEKENTLSSNIWIKVLAVVAVLIVVVMLGIKMMGKEGNPNPITTDMPTSAVSAADEQAFLQAKTKNTIAAWESFINSNPKSARLDEANKSLKTLKQELDTLLKNIEQLKDEKETMEVAKTEWQKAQQIDPTNSEVVRLGKLLKIENQKK